MLLVWPALFCCILTNGAILAHSVKSFTKIERYTLASTKKGPKLINSQGQIVRRWKTPLSLRRARLLSNGNLFGLHRKQTWVEVGASGEIRRSSKVGSIHHDYVELPDGSFLFLSRKLDKSTHLKELGKIWIDSFKHVDPSLKKVLWEATIPQLLSETPDWDSKFKTRKSLTKDNGQFDWSHLNGVHLISKNASAAKNRIFSEGNILFSLAYLNCIGILDWNTKKVVWLWGTDQLDSPHTPSVLENGHILLLDNGRTRGFSRILEYNPIQKSVVWQYGQSPGQSFYSPSKGSVQRLANGNTFLAISKMSLLVEISPEGKIVWKHRISKKKNRLLQAYRYSQAQMSSMLHNE